MKLLALNPYHAGSHASFLDTWQRHSRHDFTVRTLPARHWKWRMRHAAVTFSAQLADATHRSDAIFTTDMCNVAELRGLLPRPLRDLPITLYMHENQLTYPNRTRTPDQVERDLHLPITNLVSALAADRIWFNSAYHRDTFLAAIPTLLKQMPDHAPSHAVDDIAAKSSVQHPPITCPSVPAPRTTHHAEPPLLLTNHRWEHDKNPETVFHALYALADTGARFRLAVLGERFARTPAIYDEARARLADHIEHWGYLESRDAYEAMLARADVVISAAHHEFFGIGVLEAVAAGALPLVPKGLAYPETLAPEMLETSHDPFHDNTPAHLAQRLRALLDNPPPGKEHHRWASHVTSRFDAPRRARTMDDAIRACT